MWFGDEGYRVNSAQRLPVSSEVSRAGRRIFSWCLLDALLRVSRRVRETESRRRAGQRVGERETTVREGRDDDRRRVEDRAGTEEAPTRRGKE
jgi:hypothetical protein